MEQVRIGIDIGNVIIGGPSELPDTSFFGDNFLDTPPVPESFESIRMLSEEYDVWLISKCGQKVQDRTLVWLEEYKFFETTGVNPEQVLFCRKRTDKAPLAESLDLRAFIDDRTDIIATMKGVVELPVLFTSWPETLEALKNQGF